MFELFEKGQVEDGTIEHSIGTFHLDDMKLHLHPGLVSLHPNSGGFLVWNDAWGVLNGSKVDVAMNPWQSALTTVYQGGFPDFPYAHENMLAWVDLGYWPSPIRRYTVKDGVKTLVQGNNWGAVGLGIGDERIAWIKVTGFEASLGIYESARMAWTPRTDDPANVQIIDGPSLTDKFTGRPQIGTVGDYIVVTISGHGGTGLPSATYVLQVSTGKLWYIEAPKNTYVTLAALGTKEILVMTTSFKINPNFFENYIRYDLSKLDQLGQLVAP
ncbi:MAG TPA: hypothetical protein PK156_28425 [Polyangium sp.]|nr:hypothetical protein [Polyangium sp.]